MYKYVYARIQATITLHESFITSFSLALSYLYFGQVVSFSLRCQRYLVGLSLPSGQRHHCRLPLILISLRLFDFFVGHFDSFCVVLF